MKYSLYSLITLLAVTIGWTQPLTAADAEESPAEPLVMVVQDPLAAPLSCPCVEGYAQRKYEKLGTYLEEKLGRKVNVVFGGSLKLAMEDKAADGRADLIIGKNSVVRSDAALAEMKVTEVAHLSGKKGSTKQHGLIVVYKDDPAKTISDLNGYTIIFGPKDCDEKHAAAFDLLKSHDVEIPDELTIDQSCSEGAAKIVERGADGKTAAVISSYASPLLEGCGTVKKGDLRVLGRTKDIPFITAFTTDSVSSSEREQVQKALLSIHENPDLLAALETLIGFLPPEKDKQDVAKTSIRAESTKKN